MKPLKKHVFIKLDMHPENVGSIVLPANLPYRQIPTTGIVTAIADDANAEFKVGDHVLFDSHKCDIESIKGENGKRVARTRVENVMAVL